MDQKKFKDSKDEASNDRKGEGKLQRQIRGDVCMYMFMPQGLALIKE